MDCLAPPLANPAKATARAQHQLVPLVRQDQPDRLVQPDRPAPRDQLVRLVLLETVTATAAKAPRDQPVRLDQPDQRVPRDQLVRPAPRDQLVLVLLETVTA